jgi:predicted double-glycine peptidase
MWFFPLMSVSRSAKVSDFKSKWEFIVFQMIYKLEHWKPFHLHIIWVLINNVSMWIFYLQCLCSYLIEFD